MRVRIAECESRPARDLVLGMLAWDEGDGPAAERWLCRAVDPDIHPNPPLDVLATALARLARVCGTQGRPAEGAEAARQALRLLGGRGPLTSECWSALPMAIGMRYGAPAALKELATRLPEVPGAMAPIDVDLLILRGALGFYAGHTTAAVADLRTAIRLAGHGAPATLLPRAHLHLAQLLPYLEELDEAQVHADLALSLVAGDRQVWLESQVQAALVRVLAARGEWAEDDNALAAARRLATELGTPEALGGVLIAEATLARAQGEPRRVVSALSPMAQGAIPGGISPQTASGSWMRPDGLRPATKKASEASTHKLKTRLTRGEKKDRKRMAELAVVYDCKPVPREPSDILARSEDGPKPDAPIAGAKWLTASVVEDAKEVIKAAFDEGERRDPEHLRPWVALVDGANHQIDRIKAEAKRREIDVTIVIVCVHVLEHLWGADRCFYAETDPPGEAFVAEKMPEVLEGRACVVAGSIRRKATMLGLDADERNKAAECASYLKHKQPYLVYPTALARGWPIATGVIEGAVRYVCRDRMDVTGARWSVDGAEAVLKLRAVRANGDWPAYWHYHLAEERARVHESRYIDGVIPQAA